MPKIALRPISLAAHHLSLSFIAPSRWQRGRQAHGEYPIGCRTAVTAVPAASPIAGKGCVRLVPLSPCAALRLLQLGWRAVCRDLPQAHPRALPAELGDAAAARLPAARAAVHARADARPRPPQPLRRARRRRGPRAALCRALARALRHVVAQRRVRHGDARGDAVDPQALRDARMPLPGRAPAAPARRRPQRRRARRPVRPAALGPRRSGRAAAPAQPGGAAVDARGAGAAVRARVHPPARRTRAAPRRHRPAWLRRAAASHPHRLRGRLQGPRRRAHRDPTGGAYIPQGCAAARRHQRDPVGAALVRPQRTGTPPSLARAAEHSRRRRLPRSGRRERLLPLPFSAGGGWRRAGGPRRDPSAGRDTVPAGAACGGHVRARRRGRRLLRAHRSGPR